jgi:hypothetical protein
MKAEKDQPETTKETPMNKTPYAVEDLANALAIASGRPGPATWNGYLRILKNTKGSVINETAQTFSRFSDDINRGLQFLYGSGTTIQLPLPANQTPNELQTMLLTMDYDKLEWHQKPRLSETLRRMLQPGEKMVKVFHHHWGDPTIQGEWTVSRVLGTRIALKFKEDDEQESQNVKFTGESFQGSSCDTWYAANDPYLKVVKRGENGRRIVGKIKTEVEAVLEKLAGSRREDYKSLLAELKKVVDNYGGNAGLCAPDPETL